MSYGGLTAYNKLSQQKIKVSSISDPIREYHNIYIKSLKMIGDLNKEKHKYIKLFGHKELLPPEPDIYKIINELNCLVSDPECWLIRVKKMKEIINLYLTFIKEVQNKYIKWTNAQKSLKKKFLFLLSFEKINEIYDSGFTTDPLKTSFDNDRINLIHTWAFFSDLGNIIIDSKNKYTMEYKKNGYINVIPSFTEFALGKSKKDKEKYLQQISEMYCSIPRITSTSNPRAGARRRLRNLNYNLVAQPKQFIECTDGVMIPYNENDTNALGAKNCDSSAAKILKKNSIKCNEKTKKWEWTLIR